MSNKNKRIAIFFALFITCALAYFAPSEEPDNAIISRTIKKALSKDQAKSTKTDVTSNPLLKDRRAFDLPQGNLFSIIKPPKALTIVEKPKAPPLPFAYMGKQTEGGRTKLFLASDTKTYIVSIGDTIDGTYVVENVTGRSITLKYIPLNEQQMLLMP